MEMATLPLMRIGNLLEHKKDLVQCPDLLNKQIWRILMKKKFLVMGKRLKEISRKIIFKMYLKISQTSEILKIIERENEDIKFYLSMI